MPTFTQRIFSPRWGHDDTYRFTFEADHLNIEILPPGSMCVELVEGSILWRTRTFAAMLRNDGINPLYGIDDAVSGLWKDWKHARIDEQGVRAALDHLVQTLNQATRERHAEPPAGDRH